MVLHCITINAMIIISLIKFIWELESEPIVPLNIHYVPYKCLLALNMLNCFKDYQIYIHIFNRILDMALPDIMYIL